MKINQYITTMPEPKSFPPGHVLTPPPGDMFNEPNAGNPPCYCKACLETGPTAPLEGEWTQQRLEEGDPNKC